MGVARVAGRVVKAGWGSEGWTGRVVKAGLGRVVKAEVDEDELDAFSGVGGARSQRDATADAWRVDGRVAWIIHRGQFITLSVHIPGVDGRVAWIIHIWPVYHTERPHARGRRTGSVDHTPWPVYHTERPHARGRRTGSVDHTPWSVYHTERPHARGRRTGSAERRSCRCVSSSS